jgi:hypothetical protein
MAAVVPSRVRRDAGLDDDLVTRRRVVISRDVVVRTFRASSTEEIA